MNLPPTPSNLWTERYESLRRHCVDGCKLLGAEPLSLTLFLQKGLANWMRAWQSGTTAEPIPTASSWQWGIPPTEPVWQQELTQLIAHMTIQQLHPVPQPLYEC